MRCSDGKNGIGPAIDAAERIHGNHEIFVILFPRFSSLASGQWLYALPKKVRQGAETKKFLS
jgi:hypothetical protein